jgi:glycosyltransferase involved in cell wall biosynthesis
VTNHEDDELRYVILGASVLLHIGIHGALIDAPPPGVLYVQSDAIHTFIWPRRGDALFSAQALFEGVDFGPGPSPVHSTKWPVLHRRGWIADLDCFGYAIWCSHYGLTAAFQERESRRATRSAAFDRIARLRARNLIRAYAHPSCKAVLLHTVEERRTAEWWLDRLEAGPDGAALTRKMAVLYPAVRPVPRAHVERKWSADRLRVIFCGRGFEAKRGGWTLEAFRRILERDQSVECVYVGDVPPGHEALARLRGHPRFQHHSSLDHDAVLARFADAHVLFHPAENESLGAVFLEAAAAGLAVITAIGPGMRHVTEWFGDGGAVLIDRDRYRASEARAFAEALETLAADPSRARACGLHNYRTATDGVLSLAHRDRILTDAYDRCLDRQSPPLTLEDLTGFDDSGVSRLMSRDLVREIQRYRREHAITNLQLDLSFEL